MKVAFPNKALLRWYKRLRRIQSLLHGLRKGSPSPPAWSYQAQCWSSIIRAPGFAPNFVSWWLLRPIKLQSSPLVLAGLPSLRQMESIFDDFRLNFRHLESWHQRQAVKQSQLRKESSLKALFRDYRPDGPAPLDFLTRSCTGSIVAVDPPTGHVLIDSTGDVLSGHWTLQNSPIRLYPVDASAPDSLNRRWCAIESDILPIPGHTLTQSCPISLIPEIHTELLDFWKQRWQMIPAIPEEAWTRITDFVRAFVPRLTLRHDSLTAASLRSAFKSGRSLKTGGPDGWRRLDITSLPDDMLWDAVDLFRAIEGGLPWPTQLTRGHVFCLQKKPNLHDVGNFRPVVLFSLWARLWSNLRARHYLCQLERHACFAAFGFLPGRSCMDLTFALQSAIETALRSGNVLSGALFDIEKCFNNIPRKPILFLAEWFGLDQGVIRAWSSFSCNKSIVPLLFIRSPVTPCCRTLDCQKATP